MNKLELRLKVISINQSLNELYNTTILSTANAYKDIKRQQSKARFYQYMLERK